MTQQQRDGLPAVEDLGHLLTALESHATHDVLVADCSIFHRLDQDVAEVAVELPLQGLDFLLALLRIGISQVFPDYAMAVAQHIGYQNKQDVTEQVVHPQRQQRQQVPRPVNHPKPYILKSLFHYHLRNYNKS